MITAIALTLLLAQPKPDAPIAVPAAPVKLEQGQLAPFPGVLDTEASFVDTEKRLAAAEAKVKVYEASPPVPVLVVAVVVSVVLAGAAGAGITYAATRPKP